MLVPTGRAPHKEIEDDPGADVRLEMARLAARDEPGVEASGVEVESDRVSYSYLTLQDLSAADPGRDLWFLMGADMAASLGSWERPERVVELARIGVVPRPGTDLKRVRRALEELGAADRAEIIRMPKCDLSSTKIRERAARGMPLRHLVPDAVAELIAARGLYR